MNFPVAQTKTNIFLKSNKLSLALFDWIFVITGGLVFALPFVLLMGEEGLGRSDVVRWYFWINALISSPHVYATYVRLNRKINEGKVHFTVGLPGYFLLVGVLFYASHIGYFIEAMTAVNVWQSFHYLRQVYGVGRLFDGNKNMTSFDRKIRYWSYHLPMPALILGRWDMLYEVWKGQTQAFKPFDFSDQLMTVLWIIAATGVTIGLAGEIKTYIKNKHSYSPANLFNYFVYMGIHIYGFVTISHYQRGFFAITIFHAIQYLGLVWQQERKVAVMKRKKWIPEIPNIIGFTCFWIVLFLLGYGYEQKVTVALNSYWMQASTMLLAAVSAHHYTVDTFIWRRKAGI